MRITPARRKALLKFLEHGYALAGARTAGDRVDAAVVQDFVEGGYIVWAPATSRYLLTSKGKERADRYRHLLTTGEPA